MNILDKIKKNWDFNKTVEQNVITFDTKEKQEKKLRRNLIIFSIIAIALSILFHNPMLCFALMIGAITFGSESIFNNASTSLVSIKYLSASKIVVAYQDVGNSNRGTAIIGDISEDTISWGSETVFETGQSAQISLDKMDSTHFVVSYVDQGDYPYYTKVVCCSVSGNTITVGTIVQVSSSVSPTNWKESNICRITDTKFVVIYQIYDNPNWKMKAKVGDISGTDITLGNEYAIATQGESGYTFSGLSICRMSDSQFAVAHDDGSSNHHGQAWVGDISSGTVITNSSFYEFTTEKTYLTQIVALTSTKFVILYKYSSSSGYKGKAIIGNVSSSTISYGTATAVISGGTFENEFEVVRLSDTKFLLAGKRGSGTVSGVVEIGDVSTDTITMSSETLFNSGSTTMISCDSVSETEFIIAYSDYGNSNKGTAIIGTYSESSAFIPRTMWFN